MKRDLTSDDIADLVEGRVKEEQLTYPLEPKKDGEISSTFVRSCLEANELGDGVLFSELLKDRFVFNASAGEWFAWAGHYWKRDIKDTVLCFVESVASVYADEINKIGEEITWSLKKKDLERIEQLENLRKAMIKRIHRLRSDKGRSACVKFSRTCKDPLSIEGDNFDRDPWLLACKNGVLDLRSGRFRDGRPEDLLTLACPTLWKGFDCEAPLFENWLIEVFSEDKELIAFLQRLLGYAITGLNREHIFVVFYGAGRNGKSTLIELLNYVLGPLSGSIPSEMLISSKYAKSAAGPSPDIMGLKGLRLAFASETDEGQKFSAARVKWLTGADQLVGRNPHDKYQVRFNPVHKLFLLTNFKPQAPPDDFPFWERLLLIPFKLAFVDREPVLDHECRIKKGIIEDLKAEASGILAWLVKGCIEYQSQGLNVPKSVKEETAAYRRDEDLLGQWIESCCSLGKGKEQSKTLYESFSKWYEETISEKSIPSHIKFSKMMARRFERDDSGRVHYFLGIEVL